MKVSNYEFIGPSTLDTITASVIPKSKAAATTSAPAPPSAQEAQSAYASQLTAIPEFESYGALLNSSAKPIPLTESETEYVVTCVKHIFKEHVVFQVCVII
jgi:coatomer subunit gamma